jgi:cullin 3
MIEIQNHRAGNLSYEENHRYAYNMVLMKYGEQLYKGTCELISANLEKLAKQVIIPAFPSSNGDPIQRSQEGEVLLKAIRKVWDDHTSSLSKLRDVLKYMVRCHPLLSSIPDLFAVGSCVH